MSISGVGFGPNPSLLALQQSSAASARTQADNAAQQGAGAAVQAAQSQGVGGVQFDPPSVASADDARSLVANALTASPARVPQPVAVAQVSESDTAVAAAVQSVNAIFQPYNSNALQQSYGSSLPRGNTVDAVA